MPSEQLYRQLILDRYHQPQYRGQLARPDAQAKETNALCGDWLSMQLTIESNVVTAAKWTGEGCAISLASADLVSEHITGRSLTEADAISEKDVLTWLGIEIKPARLQCALLSLACLRSSLLSGQTAENDVS